MSTTATPRVGPELREARRRAGLTQERLAQVAGCSLAYVRQLETGLAPANSQKLADIWRVLDALLGDRTRGGDRLT
ncbi:MAG: helix-turn-helix domain-containing protein [Solirubrobacteraceae bacterium]